jgi:hypothetical protein
MKDYKSYIKETEKQKYLNISSILHHNKSLAVAQKIIEDVVIGETCVFNIFNPTLKKSVVSSVEIDDDQSVYFNGYKVDIEYSIEIVEGKSENQNLPVVSGQQPNNNLVIGFPSGEVLRLKNDIIDKLKKEGLVTFRELMRWGGKNYRNINFFKDIDYYRIKKSIDPDYEKPVKTKTNISPKLSYKKGDVVVCEGSSQGLNVEGRLGKIINMIDRNKNDYFYLVEFLFRFSKMLHPGSSDKFTGNCWWVKIENIKGLYTGDIGAHLRLKDKEAHSEPLEDHEIDDEYHIKRLYKDYEHD